MIDRYAIYSDFKDINKRYGLTGDEFTVPNYNASPSQPLPVISNTSKKVISFYYWGINKEWSNNKSISPKLLTADVDNLLGKTTLKSALMNKRCIIAANGFYLWKQYGKKRKTPHYFSLPDQEIFSLPGIWEEFDDMNGKTTHTFKIIERQNYTSIPEFGDLMPTIISTEDESKWLDEYTSADELIDLLKKNDLTSKLTNHPVSPHIANPATNTKSLIQPQAQVDQLGNYTLFD